MVGVNASGDGVGKDKGITIRPRPLNGGNYSLQEYTNVSNRVQSFSCKILKRFRQILKWNVMVPHLNRILRTDSRLFLLEEPPSIFTRQHPYVPRH